MSLSCLSLSYSENVNETTDRKKKRESVRIICVGSLKMYPFFLLNDFYVNTNIT